MLDPMDGNADPGKHASEQYESVAWSRSGSRQVTDRLQNNPRGLNQSINQSIPGVLHYESVTYSASSLKRILAEPLPF